MNQKWRAFAIVAVMIAGMPLAIPLEWNGWDFLNLFAFHHCGARNAPYAPGVICDARHWPMNYPPLLYWSFTWTRPLSFFTAHVVWSAVIAGGIVWAGWLWGARWFACGLLLLFPTIFSLNSGNNDIVVVLLWSVACWAWRRSVFWSGAFAGAAVAYKLYPGFALGLVMVTLAITERRALRAFAAGAGFALVLQALVFARDWLAYVPGNLASYVENVPEPGWYTHAVPGIASGWLGDARLGLVVSGTIFLAWGIFLTRVKDADRRILFAGALALSTYVVQTSYDYNLLTTYPLLAVLIAASLRERRSHFALAMCLMGLFAVGHRNIFLWTDRGRLLPAVLQIGWLLTLAVWGSLQPAAALALSAAPVPATDEAASRRRTPTP